MTLSNLALRLESRLSRYFSSQQWIVDRRAIQPHPLPGLRPRVLLSRELCLHFSIDLSKIPSSKRRLALTQQMLLLSPFPEAGHYAAWQDGRAQLWIWDRAALKKRLPTSAPHTVIPDSALSLNPTLSQGERWVTGIHGYEWQRWQNHQLIDSRWQPLCNHPAETIKHISLDQLSSLQAEDLQLLQQIGLGSIGAILLTALLLQGGAWLDLQQQQHRLQQQLESLEDENQQLSQTRRRAQQNLQLWKSRQALFSSSQSELITRLAEALPSSAGIWQRYDYQPGRIQILLRDPTPDPRDYVKRLDATGLLHGVQVQPEPRNDMLTLQATPRTNRSNR